MIVDSTEMTLTCIREAPREDTCIEVRLGDSKIEHECFEHDVVAGGLAAATTDPNSDGVLLAVGVVPDQVGTITDRDGTVQPENNVWYKIIDTKPRTVTITSTDNAQSEQVPLVYSAVTAPPGTG